MTFLDVHTDVNIIKKAAKKKKKKTKKKTIQKKQTKHWVVSNDFRTLWFDANACKLCNASHMMRNAFNSVHPSLRRKASDEVQLLSDVSVRNPGNSINNRDILAKAPSGQGTDITHSAAQVRSSR